MFLTWCALYLTAFTIISCNVDRIWTVWQNYRSHSQQDEGDYIRGDHYSADLDQQLDFVEDRDQLFGRPTIRDVLSNSGSRIQVQYIDDNLALALTRANGDNGIIDEVWNVPGRYSGMECESLRQNSGNLPTLSPTFTPTTEPGNDDEETTEAPTFSSGNDNDDDTTEAPTFSPNNDNDVDDEANNGGNQSCRPASVRCRIDEQCCSTVCENRQCQEESSDVPSMAPILSGENDDSGRNDLTRPTWEPTWMPTWAPTFGSNRLLRYNTNHGVETLAHLSSNQQSFSDPAWWNIDRWKQFVKNTAGNPSDNDVARFFDRLAADDCANRSNTRHRTIHSASPDWIHHWQIRTNRTAAPFECHYVVH